MAYNMFPMRGTIGAHGEYIPRLGFQQIENARSLRVDPSFRPSGFRPMPVYCFRIPESIDRSSQCAIGGRILLGGGPNLSTSMAQVRESWCLCLFEILFPGFVDRHMAGWVDVTWVPMTLDQARYWSDGATRTPIGVGNFGPPPASTAEADALAARAPDYQIPGLPEMSRETLGSFTDADYAAILGMLLYAVTKTPTDRNWVGFSENRPLAAAASIGRAEPFPANLVPSRATYTNFGAIMVASAGLRIGICRVLASWIQANTRDYLRGAVIGQVRLWRDYQLTSFKAVMLLVMNYGHVLRRVRALTSDLEAFDAQLERYNAVALGSGDIRPDPLVDYRNAIYGPLSDIKPVRSYPKLLMLARDYNRINAQDERDRRRWENFAPDVAADVSYEEELQRAAEEMGVSLPEREANITRPGPLAPPTAPTA